MKRTDLNTQEQNLLDSLNARASMIIQIEEILKEAKVPIDVNYLHTLENEQLESALEMFSKMEENRKKYGTVETEGDN